MNKDKVANIYDRFYFMAAAKSQYDQFWQDYEKLWKRNRDDWTGKDSWRANTVDANVRAIVDTAHSAIIATSPYPQFIAQQEQDKAKQEIIDQIYQFNFWKSKQELENYYIYLDALKLGKGFGKVVYIRDEREVQYPKEVNKDTLEITYETRTIYDYDDIKTVRVSPNRMFVDELATSLDNARDIIEEEILSIEDFQRKYKKYPNSKKVKPAGEINQTDKSGVASEPPSGGTSESGNVFHVPNSLGSDQVQALHYVSKFEDEYTIVANGELVTSGPIPYQHKQIWYFEIPFAPDSGDEFWCQGIPALIRRDVDELRKVRNMRIDRTKLNIFKPGLYSGLLEDFSEQLVELRPLTWIPVNDPKNFSHLEFGNIGAEAYKEDELINEDIRKVTGIDERVLGYSPENRTLTATEIRFLRESALRRLSRFLFLVRKVGIARESLLKLAMFKQYYDPERILHIVQNASNIFGESILLKSGDAKDVFTGDYDVRVDDSTLTPKSLAEEQVKWATAIQIIEPLAQTGEYDIIKTVDRYLESLEIDPDTIRPDKLEGDVRIAQEENSLFIDGNIVPDTPVQFITPRHTREHLVLLRNEIDMPEKIRDAVKKHIQNELKANAAKIAQQQQAQQQAQQQENPVSKAASKIPSIVNQTGAPESQTQYGNNPSQRSAMNVPQS